VVGMRGLKMGVNFVLITTVFPFVENTIGCLQRVEINGSFQWLEVYCICLYVLWESVTFGWQFVHDLTEFFPAESSLDDNEFGY
jgi:hypothetical protein